MLDDTNKLKFAQINGTKIVGKLILTSSSQSFVFPALSRASNFLSFSLTDFMFIKLLYCSAGAAVALVDIDVVEHSITFALFLMETRHIHMYLYVVAT